MSAFEAMGPDAERLKRQATVAAVAVATTLIVVKVWAWLATGSVAMLASLVDSSLDLVASLLNLIAVRHALTPADDEHRFGHGKAEAMAGLGQAAVIGGSAIFLFIQSFERLIAPVRVTETALGLAVIGISLALTVALVVFQRWVLRRTRSLAIGADSLHYATDIATNLGVVAAFILAGALDWTLADPIIGLGIAAIIAWGALQIVRGAYDELMDRELDDADRAKIVDIVRRHAAVVSLHDLRTRRAGHRSFIQLHVVLPPEMSLTDAHTISDEVEEALCAAFPDADVLIHMDPVGAELERHARGTV